MRLAENLDWEGLIRHMNIRLRHVFLNQKYNIIWPGQTRRLRLSYKQQHVSASVLHNFL
jgi:hypothetical protein